MSGIINDNKKLPSVTVMPPNTNLRDNFDFENLNVSFNGCGFLGVYHVGVASALTHHLKGIQFKNICGASAGAMAAVCLVAKVPLGKIFLWVDYTLLNTLSLIVFSPLI